MIHPAHTHIVRHPKEKLSKCSLTPLQGRPDLAFHMWSPKFEFDATGFTLLAVDAPILTEADAGRPLLLLDSTWKLLAKMTGSIRGDPVRRTLPANIQTAYPRKSKDGSDPDGGLASVEALYVARAILGDQDDTLLDGYYWRETFLAGYTLTR